MNVAQRFSTAVKDDMRHPGRWWLGLGALALTWIVADLVETPRVERDIRERATVVIDGDQAVEGAAARVSGRDVTLVGVSASPEGAEALVARIAALRGVRLVRSALTPLPTAHPFVLSIARTGDDIVLSGDVPSRRVRARILAEAARTGKHVDDRLAYAGGAPQGDLGPVVAAAVAALAKLDDGMVTVRDERVAVGGTPRHGDDGAAIEGGLRTALPTPFTLDVARFHPSIATHSPLKVERSGGGTRLSGSVPDETARKEMVDAAKAAFRSGAVTDDLHVGAGAASGSVAAASAAMPTLSRLHDGAVTFGDDGVEVSGSGHDAPAIEETRSALASTLGPRISVRSRITSDSEPGGSRATTGGGTETAGAEAKRQAPTPTTSYSFRLEIGEGKVRLSGNAPDEDTRRRIETTAKQQFFDAVVRDDLKIAAGAPEGFAGAVTDAIPSLARLGTGSFTLSGGDAGVSGEAAYPRAADEIRSALKAALGPGFVIGGDIDVASPPPLEPSACQPTYDRLLEAGRVGFATDSAVLPAQATPLLDRLVAVAKRCSSSGVAVSGYTDATGTKEHNAGLSQRRAQSVVEFLARAGLDTGRITAVGRGQDAPVASNATPEGRAENRHVEFRVVR